MRKTDVLAVLSAGYAKSLIYQVLICFLADGLNIFPQTLATDLPYVTFGFTWQTLQTSLQFFLFGPASSRFFSTSDGYFPTQNNKNKTYENAVAPTDFVTKAVA